MSSIDRRQFLHSAALATSFAANEAATLAETDGAKEDDKKHDGTMLVNKPALSEVLRDLVLANRILAREDVIDDFGHVSVRHPFDPGRYFLARSRSPELVTRDDLMEFTLDGEPVAQDGRPMYRERNIHGAVYRARPDVNAVTHHHARSVIYFSYGKVRMRPAFHMAAILGHNVPVWDSRAEFGDTNMLVETMPQAESMTKALGNERCVLIRGHGATCAGASLREVTFLSIYLKENADLLLRILPLGEPTYLTPGEIDQAGAMLLSDVAAERTWEYRVARSRRKAKRCEGQASLVRCWAGSPGGLPSGLPQIRTCRLPASGSSSHKLAPRLVRPWITRAGGNR